jgi:hypothetical protein
MRFMGQSGGTRTYHLIVSIKWKNGKFKVETWEGSTVTGIKKAVREKYKDQKVKFDFGVAWFTLSWGGH